MKEKECIFCKIIAGEVPARKLSEGRLTIAILDAFPATLGHTLIIPKTHHEDITTMSIEELREVAEQQQMLVPAICARISAGTPASPASSSCSSRVNTSLC